MCRATDCEAKKVTGGENRKRFIDLCTFPGFANEHSAVRPHPTVCHTHIRRQKGDLLNSLWVYQGRPQLLLCGYDYAILGLDAQASGTTLDCYQRILYLHELSAGAEGCQRE